MMKSVQRALTFGLMLAVSGLASAEVVLKDGHPSTYYVKNGDTLWDISARFLEHPWQWPEIWQNNQEISNPHLIYPGDEIHLTYVDGKPRLTVKRGVTETKMANGVVKLTPKVREVANDTAIPAIPMSAIQSYLKEGLVVSRKDIQQAPYLVGGEDRRVIFGEGDKVYARDTIHLWKPLETNYGIYRVGEEYVDPDTQEILGYEARQIGMASVSNHKDDMVTLRVNHSTEDLRIDDRLFSARDHAVHSVLYPSAPAHKVEAKVIRFFDRINSVARNDVLVINKGKRDDLKEGNVLDVYARGEVVRDRQRGDMVQLPREKIATLVLFRVFDKVSYALVMTSKKPIHMNDMAESPAGSY
ncbi:MAG: LysM domain-containing protein [Alcanivorax sp.]|nr:LysM domain-containing protein [Alcanivorax sp.]